LIIVATNRASECVKIARVNSNKLVQADIADICPVAVQLILNVAALFNTVPARATIPLFLDLNSDQFPFVIG
jgi:hypothetical protein